MSDLTDTDFPPLEPQPFVTEEGREIQRLRAELAAANAALAEARRMISEINDENERLSAELDAERATTASLLRIIALIREAGGFKRDGLAAMPDAVKAMRQQRDEARELYCRQIAYGLFRLTGVFDPKEIAIKRGWVGLFKANEPGSPKTTAPIHREPAPTPAPPPKKCCKGGNQSC